MIGRHRVAAWSHSVKEDNKQKNKKIKNNIQKKQNKRWRDEWPAAHCAPPIRSVHRV